MTKQYAGRAEGMVPVNINLPQSTYELLKKLTPNKKSRSSFIAQLIHCYEIQQIVNMKWKEKLTAMLHDE